MASSNDSSPSPSITSPIESCAREDLAPIRTSSLFSIKSDDVRFQILCQSAQEDPAPRVTPSSPSIISPIENLPGSTSIRQDDAKVVSLDVEKLVKSMKDELKNLQALSDGYCIYRVPAQLRELNEMAYTPQVVSIGPFHRGKKELEDMEDHKRRYFEDFLERMREVNKEKSMEKNMKKLFQFTLEREKRLRDCYAEKTDHISTEKFVKMVLVDATFIIEYLRKKYSNVCKKNDRIFNKQRMTNIIRLDILLIENQIPYFFLEGLLPLCAPQLSMKELVCLFLRDLVKWDLEVADDSDVQNLVHFLKIGLQLSNSKSTKDAAKNEGSCGNLVHFLKSCLQLSNSNSTKEEDAAKNDGKDDGDVSGGTRKLEGGGEQGRQVGEQTGRRDGKHLVHFLKSCLQLSNANSAKGHAAKYDGKVPPTISELHSAGVRFKPSSSGSLLDVKFNGKTLELPKWKINDHTEILFRNIQAFEQCHCSENSVRNYIAIMDFLINTPEDVELLVQNDIIENWLKDNQTATNLINSLGTHNLIREENFSYSTLVGQLHEYYIKRRHKWKATLEQDYFNNPWSIISFAAAALLLLLTVIQTVFSIMQFAHDAK